jgi:predicted metal-binding membrane protein
LSRPAEERALDPALARQRSLILAGLIAITVLSWIGVVRQSDAGMDMPMSGLGLTAGMGAWAFLAMWTLMMVGMMFPASAPMILTFSSIQSRRRSAGRPYVSTTVFATSYILIWVTFGILAWLFAAGADALAARSDWVMENWSRLAGVLLIAAGTYQLTPLKHVCLRRCRTPMGFLLENWRDGSSGAFAMGLRHGIYCAGCCWLLFVILVPLGVMNLIAMGALGVLIFAEKTFPRGDAIARFGGSALIAYGATVLIYPAALPGP